jgi:hypothetical protein
MKSMVVQQLALPHDVVDHICSFVFYTVADIMIRNVGKYDIVINEYKRVRKEQVLTWGVNIIHDFTVYYVLPRGNQLILTHICSRCGNYAKPKQCSNYILCQCVL